MSRQHRGKTPGDEILALIAASMVGIGLVLVIILSLAGEVYGVYAAALLVVFGGLFGIWSRLALMQQELDLAHDRITDLREWLIDTHGQAAP